MATFSNAPAVSAEVSATATTTSTMHTVAANSYAKFNMHIVNSSGSTTVTVDGRTVFVTAAPTNGTTVSGMVAGPNQAIAVVITGVSEVNISGFELTNQA